MDYIVWNKDTNEIIKTFRGSLNLDVALTLASEHNAIVTEYNYPAFPPVDHYVAWGGRLFAHFAMSEIG